MKFYARKKTALVLGGGAARGLAHLGVLKVLRREGLKFDMVMGTSIGALFAAVWALGLDLRKVEEKALRTTAKDILDVTISRIGLCKGNKVEYLIKETLENRQFEDIKIPLFVVTTDIEAGKPAMHSSGNLHEIIKASCAIPGIFMPVKINNRIMVDGGITSNIPVAFAKSRGATHVIASDVGYCIREGGMNNMLNIIIQAIQIMGERLNVYDTRKADIVIRPELGEIDQTEFHKAKEIILKGEEAADLYIKKIKRLASKGPLGTGIGFLWE